MTKEQLWDIYCSKNPSFNSPDNRISMTARGLKKMFEQTWKIAQEGNKNDVDFGKAFGDFFGKKY